MAHLIFAGTNFTHTCILLVASHVAAGPPMCAHINTVIPGRFLPNQRRLLWLTGLWRVDAPTQRVMRAFASQTHGRLAVGPPRSRRAGAQTLVACMRRSTISCACSPGWLTNWMVSNPCSRPQLAHRWRLLDGWKVGGGPQPLLSTHVRPTLSHVPLPRATNHQVALWWPGPGSSRNSWWRSTSIQLWSLASWARAAAAAGHCQNPKAESLQLGHAELRGTPDLVLAHLTPAYASRRPSSHGGA